jgi:ATP-dependent DNA helicase RecG
VIEKDRMFTENANRPDKNGAVTLDDFEPKSKNPIIAAFFRNIALADELGSGIRNLYRYGRRYSGKDPELIDGDVFRIIIPLDESYSFDVQQNKVQPEEEVKCRDRTLNCTLTEKAILDYVRENPTAKQADIAVAVGKSLRAVKVEMISLREKRLLRREGARKTGKWIAESDS